MKKSFMSRVSTVVLSLALVAVVVARAPAADALVLFTGNASFDKVFTYDGSTYSDRTSAASNATTNDVVLGSTQVNDITYFGMQSPFGAMTFKMGTWGTGNGTVQFQYSNPTSLQNIDGFNTLNLTTDPSNHFKTVTANNVTQATFTPPSDWVKKTINGVSAYWVKITTVTGYTVTPKASEILANAYNLKLQINEEFIGPRTDDMPPIVGQNCDIVDQSVYYGEWNAGAGIHYYAVKTNGGSCTLTFSSYYVGASVTANNLTTTLTDLSGTPVTLKQNLKILVKDELGNLIPDATVKWTTATTTWSGSQYYYYNGKFISYPLTISRTGYVSEDGVSGNTGLASVQPTAASETIISLTAPTSQPCTVVTTGATTNCAALRLDTDTTVNASGGGTVSGATVTFYTDAAYSMVADDQSKVGSFDASGSTDAAGKKKTALASGMYYYKVTASGYQTATGNLAVTSGILNSFSVTLTAGGPVDTTVSASQSTVLASPSTITANNTQTGTVTVTAKNAGGTGLSGKTVTLSSSLNGVTITPASASTDGSGMATFTIKSSTIGSAQFTAVADGVTVTNKPTVQFVAQGACSYTIGSLVKLPDDGNINTQADSAVYYYGKDCKRHGFPNDKVYFTWYLDFSAVTIVTSQTLANMPLGPNVTYRPGVKMVKFTTLNNVYAVGHGGVLRWVKTEPVATGLYGANWNKRIDDVSDAFYVNYTFGADINSTNDYNVVNEMNNAMTIDDNM